MSNLEYPEQMVGREILPLKSLIPIKRDEVRVIHGSRLHGPMTVDRLFIAPSGTVNGDADWIVRDLKIDGRTQLIHANARVTDLPGDLFRGTSMGGAKLGDFVLFTECKEGVELTVIYIGENPEGCVFYGALVGCPTERHCGAS